jgi:hypothetical protein
MRGLRRLLVASVLFPLVGSWAVLALAEAATQPAMGRGDNSGLTTRPARPKILPWLELTERRLIFSEKLGRVEGSEGRVTFGEYCIRGLDYWKKVTDTAIITTHPDTLKGTFEYLMARRPAGMRILGGISTYSLPGGTPQDRRPYDFADAKGWEAIAGRARHITRLTGNNVCVLENELALKPFHSDGKSIDFEKLQKTLATLRATGIEFWWYLPAIAENTAKFPNRQQESIQFIKAISTALPNCRFIVGYIGYGDWRQNKRTEITRRQMMVHMLGQPRLLDYMAVTKDGHWENGNPLLFHTSQTAFAEIKNLPEVGEICIYPGHMNWVTIAREFAEGYPLGR